jgi:hypothetical protein
MQFRVQASVGNADGVFDAAYDFGRPYGQEAQMQGTPQQIATEVARYLEGLTPEDCTTMEYGTGRFFVELQIEPAGAPAQEMSGVDPDVCHIC